MRRLLKRFILWVLAADAVPPSQVLNPAAEIDALQQELRS
jgi:hypothetical protein